LLTLSINSFPFCQPQCLCLTYHPHLPTLNFSSDIGQFFLTRFQQIKQCQHHLPPTLTDRGKGVKTKVTSSLDTMFITLSITILGPDKLCLKTRVLKLEHPSQGWTMIPQANDNERLTLIRTQQVDNTWTLTREEARIHQGTSRGKLNSGTSPNFSSCTPKRIFGCRLEGG
jgi:hypothetical protein